jgi:GntR family transcriptional regulator, histidine utilization repressor
MTVSKALAALASHGMIVRNKRAGTTVAKPPLHSAILQIPDIRHDIEARGGQYAYRCLAFETRRSSNCVFIHCLHLDDGVPLVLEERQIFLNAIPEARDVDFHTTPPGTWLINHVAWTEAEHRISACAAGVVEAGHLEVDEGAACLVLERKTWQGKITVTQVRQLFRSDNFDLVARFSPTPK